MDAYGTVNAEEWGSLPPRTAKIMRHNIFFISDHHFGHEKPYNTFLTKDGKFLRHQFPDSQTADEIMIQWHNAVVKPEDRVYFVGDVCFHRRHLEKVGRMNGRKVLIKGNHDTLDIKEYLPYFEDVRGVCEFKGGIISHIPIHVQSLARWGFNIHGHLHDNVVMMENPRTSEYEPLVPDPRYLNVSVERMNYRPISLDEAMKFKP